MANNQNEIVSLLVNDSRTDVNLKEGGGLTPLHLAVSCGNKESVQILIGHPKIERETLLDGLTALEFAKTLDGSVYDEIASLLE